MRQYGISNTLDKIRELGIVAVVRGESHRAAVEVSSALVEAGIRGIEIAFTTPGAEMALEELDEGFGESILLGAGTVTTTDDVEKASSTGSKFLVSPGFDPELVPLMKETGQLVLPGVLTPSEIMLAQRSGIETVKLFPGSLGGPSYLRSLRGPFPEMEFLPTGGISRDNIQTWFAEGACAVGIGGELAPPTLRGRDRSGVVDNARSFVDLVRDVRSPA